MGYVKTELADEEEGWTIELLADFLEAHMQKQPLFDSNSSRMRS
jgi:dimethylglycine dehydrogenase